MPYTTDRTYGPPRRQPIPDVREGYYAGDDLYRQANNNRQRAVAYGDMMNQEMQDFGNDEDYWRQYYRGEGNSAYGDIAAGRGGYRPEEQADIMGREGLDQMQLTPEQRQNLFLTEDEQSQMRGDPNNALRWFDPENLDTINTEGNSRIRENVDESGRSLNNTYNEDALSLSGGYRDELQDIINGGTGEVRGTINAGAGNVRGAINRDNLTLDPNFLEEYRMTDRDVDDITQQAALTQGNISQGRIGAIQRAAAETGGMSPLAIANAMSELTTRGDQQANRAMLEARIGAKGMQADRLRTAEGMRLGAEGDYAGMLSSAEMALGDRATDAEIGLMDRRYGAASDYERQRLGSEQDKQGRRYQIAANNADRSYDAVNQINENTRSNARYAGETGAELYHRADMTAADRAAALAGNRQSNERYAQESDYDRSKYRNDATSDRSRVVGDARRDDEAEYRDWLAGQQSQSNDNVNTSYANRIRNYGQAGQLAQGATQDSMQYDLGRRGQSFGTNFKQSSGRALGSFVGNPVEWGKVKTPGAGGSGGGN